MLIGDKLLTTVFNYNLNFCNCMGYYRAYATKPLAAL